MNDLSELLKECEILSVTKRPNYAALDRARQLAALGFDRLAQEISQKVLRDEKMECIVREKYPVVTPDRINAFLKKVVDCYNEKVVKKHGKKSRDHYEDALTTFGDINSTTNTWWDTSTSFSTGTSFNWRQLSGSIPLDSPRFIAMTNDFLTPSEDRVAGFAWKEVPVKDYDALPPDHALAALKCAQAKEIFDEFVIASVNKVKDPLLLGKIAGSEDRYFIAQWGEDVALDDVI